MNLFCRKIEVKRICMTLQHSSLDNGAQRNILFYLEAMPRYWKNETLLSMHISTYWFDFLQYACERIAKSWPALSMSPPINIPSAPRSDWPQNISRPLGCNVESIFHVDQISIHNNTVYIWLFMKASQNVREPFNQGVNPLPGGGKKIGKLAEYTLAPHSPLWLSTTDDEGVFASNRVLPG